MNLSFEELKPERDHSLLARGYAKAIETFLDDVWEWAEGETIELKSRLGMVEDDVTGASRERVKKLRQRVDEISLKSLNEAIQLLKAQIDKVKNYDYPDASFALALIEAHLVPVKEMVRIMITLREQVNAIYEAIADRE